MLDAKLPHLEKIIDEQIFAARFAEFFAPILEERDLKLENCRVESIQHSKGSRCRTLYRLKFRRSTGERFEKWFHGRALKKKRAERTYHKSQSVHNPTDFWPPVSYWRDWNFVLWAFPHDAGMPKLPKALSPEFIRAGLDANVEAFQELNSPNWRFASVEIDEIKYMPGKRCVLRYRTAFKNEIGEKKSFSFYGKAFDDSSSQFKFETLCAIYENFRHVVEIPRPLAHIPEANLIWQEDWGGKPLDEALPELDWPALFVKLGAVTAKLHMTPCTELPCLTTPKSFVRRMKEDALALVWRLPEHREYFEQVHQRLNDAHETIGAEGAPQAPTHGALRVEQFLVKGETLALLDFDEAELCDPHAEVAEFIASLRHLEFLKGLNSADLAAAASAFEEGYCKHVTWRVDQRRIAWYAAASWLTKINDSIKSLTHNANETLDSKMQLLDGWLAKLG